LKSHDSAGLKPQVGFEILSDFPDQPLEWEFPDEKFSRFLVPPDFSKSDSTWSKPVGFFDTPGGWGGFPSGFGRELLPGRFTTGRFSCGLFSSGHGCFFEI